MRIAVVHHIKAGDYAEYLSALVNSRAIQNDYAVKIWSYSIPASQQFIPENAVVYIIVEANSKLAVKWWYGVKLPNILKKIKASAVFDLNGIGAIKGGIPKILALPQEFFLDKRQTNGVHKFAREQFNDSLARAGKILLYSNDKSGGIQKKAIVQNKLEVVPFTAPAVFKTFEWHEKIMVKAQQADNKEYFIAVLEDEAEESFVTLLKAFTKFKNWQQSSMQFLILPKYESFSDSIRQKHETYKYREDVRLLEDLDETQVAAVLASAYAMVLMWTSQPDLVVLTAALQCSLPVISPANNDVEEYAGNAALYLNDTTIEGLSSAMIQLYKDEDRYGRLKEKCKERSALLNRDEYESRLWESLQTAALC